MTVAAAAAVTAEGHLFPQFPSGRATDLFSAIRHCLLILPLHHHHHHHHR